jgi:hypothetical protein
MRSSSRSIPSLTPGRRSAARRSLRRDFSASSPIPIAIPIILEILYLFIQAKASRPPNATASTSGPIRGKAR